MTTSTRPLRMRSAPSRLMSYFKSPGAVKTAAFLILSLLVGSLYFTSSASSSNKAFKEEHPALALDVITSAREKANVREVSSVKVLNSIPASSRTIPLPVLVPQSPLSVATYASDCMTPKTLFNVQDADRTVCVKVTGATPGWQLIWSNASFAAVQTNSITSANQDISFTLSTTSSLGDWRVIAYEPFGGDVHRVTSFTAIDAQNPVVDLIVNTSAISSPLSAGGQVLFGIQITNNGPSSAENVELTDAVPADLTFLSFVQLEGPVFNCTSPMTGSNSGSTFCAIASLARGDKAIFLATYEVGGGIPISTEIFNTAHVANATSDSNDENNSSTGMAIVAAMPCTLICPSNITVPADSGQAGAVVSYSAPDSTGNCGEVTSNPASGSFFPVGTTTVITAGETGNACSFQVTVENPGGLSISLVGANSLTLQCGFDFDDPGATAVNGTGDPLQVTVSGTVNTHTPGSYTLSYTAVEDQNSVSTTRTVNVSDGEAPVITINGPNPMTVSLGQLFVDPGASANDACEGAKPVNSSGTVDSNTPGMYPITYTASDSQNHTATVTRNVIVESGGAAPPTITMNGDPQMTIECGTTFSDPGATAIEPGGGPPDQFTTDNPVDSHVPGTYTVTYTACMFDSPGHCDPNQTSTAERAVTVEDSAAPIIEIHGDNPMTVECHIGFTDPGATAHDACAGDLATTASGIVDSNTVGRYTVSYSATDPSGNPAPSVTRTVNVVDTTAPIVNDPPDVMVYTGPGSTSCSVIVSDAELGTSSANDTCQGSLPPTRSGVPSSNVFPIGLTTITYSATDAHNNTGSATQTVTVVDNTAPVISCPSNITVYLPLNSTATSMVVDYAAPVGTDNCGGATTALTAGLVSGSSFPIGSTTNTFTVTDAGGNFTECSFTVTVLYNFAGFFSPVGNPPILNSVNAGRAIPVKFSLSGDKGLNIFAADNPYSVSLNCDTNDPGVDVTETVTAGSSSLSFDGGQYNYVWKTQSSWAGSCRQLVVKLNDGSVHTANFKLR